MLSSYEQYYKRRNGGPQEPIVWNRALDGNRAGRYHGSRDAGTGWKGEIGLYELNNGRLRAQVSAQGAELRSLRGADETEVLWQGDPALWRRSAPVLFPYVGRLTGGIYTYRGEEYRLPIHGFAPSSTFQTAEQTPESVVLQLRESEKTLGMYPFRFRFCVGYRLEGDTLAVAFTVENCDDKTMYFGLGAHPGFRVPLADGLRFEEYALQFCAPCAPRSIRLSRDCFILEQSDPLPLESGGMLPLRHGLFDADTLLLTDTARTVTLLAARDGHAVTVMSPDMPYLAVWQPPHTKAPFVCIEPWCSLPARSGVREDLEQQPSLLRLAAGETGVYHWSITVHTAVNAHV